MYFDKFVADPNIDKSCRYVLSGDDEFLKDFAIKQISQQAGKPTQLVTETSFKPAPKGLFDTNRIYILSSSTKCSSFCDGMIKLSNNRITKTYTNAGFIEVYCGLFPNQIPAYIGSLLKKYKLPNSYKVEIHKFCGNDTYSIYNTIQGLSFLDKDQLSSITLEHYCNNLTILDGYKVLDYFAQGNYKEFLVSLSKGRIDFIEIINLLLNLILSAQKFYINGSQAFSLYDKKLKSVAERLAPYGLEKIIHYLGNLYGSYGDSRPVMYMKIQRLIYYLSGIIRKL